jgi:hypothetical protein
MPADPDNLQDLLVNLMTVRGIAAGKVILERKETSLQQPNVLKPARRPENMGRQRSD